MYLLIFYLAVLGLHFLVFQHKHTAGVRKFLSKCCVFSLLFRCVFCQGFWSSVMLYVIVRAFTFDTFPLILSELLFLFPLALSSAFLVMLATVLMDPAITKYELKHK